MDEDEDIRYFRKIGEREIAFLGVTASRSRMIHIDAIRSADTGNWSKITAEMEKLGLREKEKK